MTSCFLCEYNWLGCFGLPRELQVKSGVGCFLPNRERQLDPKENVGLGHGVVALLLDAAQVIRAHQGVTQRTEEVQNALLLCHQPEKSTYF